MSLGLQVSFSCYTLDLKDRGVTLEDSRDYKGLEEHLQRWVGREGAERRRE